MDQASVFTLFVRIYAPFSSFGFGFEGDRRGPTTAPCVTSRIASAVTFDAAAGAIIRSQVSSSPSTFLLTGETRTARPNQRVTAVKLSRGVWLQLDISGANPLVRAAPDIDVRLRFEAAIQASRLNVVAGLSGDAFPNAEIFLQDTAGSRRMVVTYETRGGRQMGPVLLLPGNAQRSMSGICRSFGLTPGGVFAESAQGLEAA